jgi:hypothetical protein
VFDATGVDATGVDATGATGSETGPCSTGGTVPVSKLRLVLPVAINDDKKFKINNTSIIN